jgi:hypothetical protein
MTLRGRPFARGELESAGRGGRLRRPPAADRVRRRRRSSPPGTSGKGPRGRGTSGSRARPGGPRRRCAVCHCADPRHSASRAEPDDPARAVKLSGHSDRGEAKRNLAWRGWGTSFTDDRSTQSPRRASSPSPCGIGPSADEQEDARARHFSSLDDLTAAAVPAGIMVRKPLGLPPAATEAGRWTSCGPGRPQSPTHSDDGISYHTSPPVILRNVLENPGWYPRIRPTSRSLQGRLQALLSFQTVVPTSLGCHAGVAA